MHGPTNPTFVVNYVGLDVLLPRPVPLESKILVVAEMYCSHNEYVFTPDCLYIQLNLFTTS